jgi:sugar phosphate isomerase/epimerase
MKRREFLVNSATGVSACWFAGSAAAPLAAATTPPQLGAVTHSLLENWDLEKVIQVLERTGYAAVELRTENKHGVEPSISKEERVRVRERFARSKVRLLSFGTVCEFHSPDAAERRRQVEIGKTFIDLAHDTGAIGIKVRPEALPEGVPAEVTIEHIAGCLRELSDYGEPKNIEIWVEVHGPGTADPNVMAEMMEKTKRKNVGVCWNTNDTDVVNGSVKSGFDALRPWLKNIHMRDLTDKYPWHEFFGLIRSSGYSRYTLCEARGNPDGERLLKWYKALWTEYMNPCA